MRCKKNENERILVKRKHLNELRTDCTPAYEGRALRFPAILFGYVVDGHRVQFRDGRSKGALSGAACFHGSRNISFHVSIPFCRALVMQLLAATDPNQHFDQASGVKINPEWNEGKPFFLCLF